MNRLLTLVLFIVAAVEAVPCARAQAPSFPSTNMDGSAPASRSSRIPADPGSPIAGMQEKLEKGRQSERQKRLIADTDRLLALANELKADMDKTTKDQLSIEVIKKAEEIEKLARSVKDRMKG